MCHPNAANTHPETYPKYQVQLQRVALLRDMINWCIENPVKGKALPDDSRSLRALEAYILAAAQGPEARLRKALKGLIEAKLRHLARTVRSRSDACLDSSRRAAFPWLASTLAARVVQEAVPEPDDPDVEWVTWDAAPRFTFSPRTRNSRPS